MKTSNYIFAIMAVVIILCCTTIANAKLNKWKNFQTSRMTENYLKMLEDNDKPLDVEGQKSMMREAWDK